MFEQELDLLLEKDWSDEQRVLIKRLMDNVAYYKKLLPKSLKQDVFEALQMCNTLKNELEYYKKLYKCNLNSQQGENECENIGENECENIGENESKNIGENESENICKCGEN
jgi:hypothetical protein